MVEATSKDLSIKDINLDSSWSNHENNFHTLLNEIYIPEPH